jgi:acyl-CoA synthetase (AMP-forming)/AMP-acid ligase II
LSTGLGRLGIARGDRLAMLLPNGLVGIELFASSILSGHVIEPLNFRWSIDELADAVAEPTYGSSLRGAHYALGAMERRTSQADAAVAGKCRSSAFIARTI